jgi:hypothetical protein
MKWFSLGTPVSSTNKTDRRDKVKILLKVEILDNHHSVLGSFGISTKNWIFRHFTDY